MLTAEARVETDRAGRYLAQLCRHVGRLGGQGGGQGGGHAGGHLAGHLRGRGGGGAPRVESSETDGTLDLGWGRCVLRADDDALLLTAEADDEERLRRIQDLVGARLERIGRRDGLRVTWRGPRRT